MSYNNLKTICFTGPRPKDLNNDYDCKLPINRRIKEQLANIICILAQKGYEVFISGGALGIDQWAIEEVLECHEDGATHIKLIIAKPFPSQSSNWSIDSQIYFEELCQRADEVINVSEDPYAGWKMQLRNKWMVDRSDIVVAIWNGKYKHADGTNSGTGNCVKYALKMKKKIIQYNYETGEIIKYNF